MKSILFLFMILPSFLSSQEGDSKILGQVIEEKADGRIITLIGANIYWLGTEVGAISDMDGNFEIPKSRQSDILITSYIGYQTDTLQYLGSAEVTISLKQNVTLDEVKVVGRKRTTEISYVNPLKVEKISEKELLKAACCNLSESFETSPSVDVSFTDAVTGTRQIQMLGLAGPYTQITRESMPDVRGLSALYGLTFIPGTWVESIQLMKGTGTVANGFESIAGQINVELRKPQEADRMYLNFYGNEGGRYEANANFAHKINDHVSTALLLHGKTNSRRNDRNEDGFLDMPLGDQFIVLNRWQFVGDEWRGQVGIKGTSIKNIAGQLEFDPENVRPDVWGMDMGLKRFDAWSKVGKVFTDMPWKSIGLQFSGSFHDQDSYFGNRIYNASQQSLYTNMMYQSILSNTNHVFRTGLSVQYDKYEEVLDAQVFDRKEIVPGAFFEYTYLKGEEFTVVAGLRADYHNIYGAFLTPRVHARYAVTEETVLRASVGKGQRTASIIAENSGLLASARQIEILGDGSDKPYGLEQEVAWNFGLSVSQTFRLDYREGSFSMDYYYTDFKNQIVLDLDQSPRKALFYNLSGPSFAKSFQAQLDYELFNRFDVRLAYRWYDVQTTYDGVLSKKPLLSSNRAFVNLGYGTRNQWKFDYTLNWQGEKRIPNTIGNPEELQLDAWSPNFILMNAQISKTWNEKFEVYVGMENILDFTQKNPILSSAEPFSDYFDSSIVWGPVFGRNTYVGLRYRLK